MAKLVKTVSFNNCELDIENSILIERDKNGDETGRYSLEKVLSDWDGIPGIAITIKQADEIVSDMGGDF